MAEAPAEVLKPEQPIRTTHKNPQRHEWRWGFPGLRPMLIMGMLRFQLAIVLADGGLRMGVSFIFHLNGDVSDFLPGHRFFDLP
jgi:hypothetical protein